MTKAKDPFNVIGIDVGYGFTKALKSLEAKPIVFPSLVAPAVADFDTGLGRKRTSIQVDNAAYFVGLDADVSKLAQTTASRERLDSQEFKVLFLAAVSRLYPTGAGNLLVSTGLPGAWLADSQTLVKSLAGTHNIKVGNRTVGYEIKRVVAAPQVFGSWVREAFTLNGGGKPTVTDEKLATQPVIIVDFGTLTTGFAYMAGNYVGERSGSIEVGMSDLVSALREISVREFRYEPPYSELIKALISGKLTVYGQPQEISKLIEPAKAQIIEAAWSKAQGLWGAGQQAGTLLLTGGGATILGDAFRFRYGHPNTIIVPDSQVANVQGLYIYGRFQA